MKGTAMAMVMVGGTEAISSCTIEVPQFFIQKGARMDSFVCTGLTKSCCSGLNDVEQVVNHGLHGKGDPRFDPYFPHDNQRDQMIGDMIGTCGRADQVNLFECYKNTFPHLVPQGMEGKTRSMIQGKGCNPQVSRGTDGSGVCSLKGGKLKVEGVSTGCCDAAAAMSTVDDEAAQKKASCGTIGACGKKDQLSILKFVKGKGKGDGSEVELLETFNMNQGGAQQMLATFMTSEVEDDETEDATEDGSQVVTGLLGFVAGAAVTGLGVTVLRCRTPSQDEYNEIVA